ncbi:uncharacterized protein LOC117335877 [Pecten maximus]|uniref:uncharacterized protein LOC117335877 n=1 Tax=Pecten maximus TaxID=6579 RepID=UPI001458FE00|nr:uncharacterized protein LOC117335877 [Pecten maximus]
MAQDNNLHIADGLDLIEAAIREVKFLEKVDQQPSLYSGPIVRRAIYRYESLWLPLAAKHNKNTLVAPLDIAWVWHCHMLAPVAYTRDCEKAVGCVVDFKIFLNNRDNQYNMDLARSYWEEMYPGEPFAVCLDEESCSNTDFTSSFTYDIEKAVKRQQAFYYQVSLPHYLDKKFMSAGLKRYEKFLSLKKMNPELFIVPCYDIDLIWHTHQLHPITYKEDTVRILGTHFNHDDSVNDRSLGSKLCTASSETQKCWQQMFGEDFSYFGAMYRGDSPAGRLCEVPVTQIYAECSKIASFNIQSIDIDNETMHPKKIASLKFMSILEGGIDLELLKLKKPHDHHHRLWNETNLSTANKNYEIDTNFSKSVHLRLSRKTGFVKKFTGKPPRVIGTFEVDSILKKCLANDDKVTSVGTVCEMSDGSIIKLQQNVEIIKISQCRLGVQIGTFEDAVMPEVSEQLWGPIPLPRLPAGQQNTCSVASHRVRNMRGQVMFTCRVIHSIALLTSAVQIYYQDKLAVVCHLIGTDQLPLPSQVDKDVCPVLSPSKGERAILIKNNKGDWAIVVASWTGRKRGVPGTRGKRGIPGSQGHLGVKVFLTARNTWTTAEVDLNPHSDQYTVKLDGVTMELIDGTITYTKNFTEMAEKLGLIFSVSLLHVLCQPRPKNWQPGQSLQTPAKKRGKVRIQQLPSEDHMMLVGMGLMMLTPCNHFIRHKFGPDKSRQFFLHGTQDMSDGSDEEGFLNTELGDGEVRGHLDLELKVENSESDQETEENEWDFDVDLEGDVEGEETGGCGGCGGCGGGGDDGGSGWGGGGDGGGSGWGGDGGGGDGGGGDGGGSGWGGDGGGGDNGGWGGGDGGWGGDGGGGGGDGGGAGGCGGGGCGGGGCGGCGG